MVNAPKGIISLFPDGKYDKLTNRSTRRRHQANEGTCGLEPETLRALGVLSRFESNKKLAAETGQETNFLNKIETEKWIEDYME
jgi:hypothetical protein